MSDANQYQFPKLHNAMWPGLVGKGPDSEPPIDLDTMLDLTAGRGGRWDQVRRSRSFSFPAAHRYRFVRGRSQASGGKHRETGIGRRIPGCAGVASHRWRLRDGIGGRAKELRHAGAKSLRDRESSFAIWAYASMESCALTPHPVRLSGPRIRRGIRNGLRKRFAKHAQSPKATASD